MRVESRSLWSHEPISSLSKNGFACRWVEEFSRTSKLLPILLLGFVSFCGSLKQFLLLQVCHGRGHIWCFAVAVPTESRVFMGAVDALQISLLSKPFQTFLQCLNASHTNLLSHCAYLLTTFPASVPCSPDLQSGSIPGHQSFGGCKSAAAARSYAFFHLWHHIKPTWNLSFMLCLWTLESI